MRRRASWLMPVVCAAFAAATGGCAAEIGDVDTDDDHGEDSAFLTFEAGAVDAATGTSAIV